MAICQHCDRKWTYADSLRGLFAQVCRYCQQRNYRTTKTKRLDSVLAIIPLLLIGVLSMMQLPLVSIITCGIIGSGLTLAVHPLYLKLSKQDDIV